MGNKLRVNSIFLIMKRMCMILVKKEVHIHMEAVVISTVSLNNKIFSIIEYYSVLILVDMNKYTSRQS